MSSTPSLVHIGGAWAERDEVLAIHHARIEDLRTEVEQLQERQGGTDAESQSTVWRERINLVQTIKEGWRVGEVTIEVTYSDHQRPTEIDKRNRMITAIERGQEVADRQNTLRTVSLTNKG